MERRRLANEVIQIHMFLSGLAIGFTLCFCVFLVSHVLFLTYYSIIMTFTKCVLHTSIYTSNQNCKYHFGFILPYILQIKTVNIILAYIRNGIANFQPKKQKGNLVKYPSTAGFEPAWA